MSEEKKTHPEHKYSVTFVSKVGTIRKLIYFFIIQIICSLYPQINYNWIYLASHILIIRTNDSPQFNLECIDPPLTRDIRTQCITRVNYPELTKLATGLIALYTFCDSNTSQNSSNKTKEKLIIEKQKFKFYTRY